MDSREVHRGADHREEEEEEEEEGEKEGRINLISRWIDRNQGIYRRISRVSKIVSGETSREDALTSPFFD